MASNEDWIDTFIAVTGASQAEALEFLGHAGAVGPQGDMSMEALVNLFIDSRETIPPTEQQAMRAPTLSIIDPLRNFEVETSLQEQAVEPGPRVIPPGPVLDASRDPNAGFNRFEDLFRTPLDLIFTGDLAQARQYATSESRWLLVEIQNRTIFNSLITSRDLWPNAAVRTLVQENFVFTQYDAETHSLAEYISRLYQVNLELLPYLALIDPRTGENLHHWGGTGEAVDVLRFAAYLRAFIEVNGQITNLNPPVEVPDALVQQHYEIEADMQQAIQASVAQQPGHQDTQ